MNLALVVAMLAVIVTFLRIFFLPISPAAADSQPLSPSLDTVRIIVNGQEFVAILHDQEIVAILPGPSTVNAHTSYGPVPEDSTDEDDVTK